MRKRNSGGLKKITAWDIGISVICLLIAAVVLFPFLNVLAVSLSTEVEYLLNPMMIFPKSVDFSSYSKIMSEKLILNGYWNTLVVTILGVLLSMFLSITIAYPLSRSDFMGGQYLSGILIFTMLFNGGLIPNFILVKGLGLFNTIWALIIPGSLSAYNCILMRKFFQSIPNALVESAVIDGASDLQILIRIILPLSKPIISTITLFYAVSRWNSFFQAIVYVKDRSLWTLQLVLREIVMSAQALENDLVVTASPRAIKYAAIVVTTVPILCVYPFVQKHFIKGMMLGAVKG